MIKLLYRHTILVQCTLVNLVCPWDRQFGYLDSNQCVYLCKPKLYENMR